MKKIFSIFLSVILLTCAVLPTVSVAEDVPSLTLTVESKEATAGTLVGVAIGVNSDSATNIGSAKIDITYDTALQLVDVVNADTFFASSEKGAVYEQDVGAENGKYTYIGFYDFSATELNSKKIRGTFCTLYFKVPDSATVGTTYTVTIENTSAVLELQEGAQDITRSYSVQSGNITVCEPLLCVEHTMGDLQTVSTQSYVKGGFSYRECSVCHYTTIEKSAVKESEIVSFKGVAIRYQGKPNGIASTFVVDEDKITALEQSGYTVELRLTTKTPSATETEVWYGVGATKTIENHLMISKLTGVSVKAKTEFSVEITITETATRLEKTENVCAVLNKSEKISIEDVAKKMDLSKYSTDSQKYLNSVINGFVD